MKTKSLIITLVAFLGLCPCEQSKEEKAQQMIAEYLKGFMYNADSYEPLQTKVDSLFVSLSFDKEAIELTLDMLKLFQTAEEYIHKFEDAERDMDTWTFDGFSSSYTRGEYRRAKKERDENKRRFEKTKGRIKAQFDKIKARQSAINTGAFDGWKVYHRFKCLNGAGTLDLIDEYIFFCDKNFNVKFAYSKENFDSISVVMNTIAESDEVFEFMEKVQDVIF